jgi:hypothetical protein
VECFSVKLDDVYGNIRLWRVNVFVFVISFRWKRLWTLWWSVTVTVNVGNILINLYYQVFKIWYVRWGQPAHLEDCLFIYVFVYLLTYGVFAQFGSVFLFSLVYHESWYLGTTLTYQNSIQEEIKSRLKLGNACFWSVQNLLSSSLLSKNLKINICRTIILPVVLYGCETWSLKLREERRLRW